MKSASVLLLVLVSAVLMTAAPATAEPPAPLEAGVAVVDITPPLGYRLSGYFHERLATGVRDPLGAKAIVLRQGKVEAAMVFCDLIGVPRELTEAARAEAERKTGIPAENILVAATHSHTGPLYFGALRDRFHNEAVTRQGSDPQEKVDYAALLEKKIVGAVEAARAGLAPVVLEAGTAQQLGLSFNRRFFMKDGPVQFNPGVLNPNIIKPCAPVDPEVGIALFKKADGGGPLASLTVFALHLDTVGGTLYSADFPHFLEQSLREEMGEGFVSLFGNGPCGDINHINVTTREQLTTEKIGRGLGATVKEALPGLKPAQPSLAVRTEVIHAPLQKYSEEEIARARAKMGRVADRDVPFLERVTTYKIVALQSLDGNTLPMTVQVFRLSRDTAIVAVPGELFVDLGLAIKKASPFATTMVIELAHDACAYVPTEKAFREGSYETVNSRIQPGSGEKLVETAVRLLGDLKL